MKCGIVDRVGMVVAAVVLLMGTQAVLAKHDSEETKKGGVRFKTETYEETAKEPKHTAVEVADGPRWHVDVRLGWFRELPGRVYLECYSCSSGLTTEWHSTHWIRSHSVSLKYCGICHGLYHRHSHAHFYTSRSWHSYRSPHYGHGFRWGFGIGGSFGNW